jgi:uncharacterized protein YgiM (DUF1202 family)
MKSKFGIGILCLFLSIAIVAAQVSECSEMIQIALEAAEEQCEDAGRNQVCYGYTALIAEAQPDATDFTFEKVGDIADVAAIQRLQLAGLDVENGIWGVVLMRVQANIPDTLPGQNVTVMLFGNTEIRNAAASVAQQIPPEQQRSITANQSINVRELPSTNGRVLGSSASGTAITATGRTADNSWIRVRFGEQTGWIRADLLSADDVSALLVVEPEEPQFGPMQAFYFTAGVGQTQCNEVPDDGMLIQTPAGVGSIDLMVNEVEVNMGSTVYFTINDEGDMEISTIEGGARVTSEGETQIIPAGTQAEIPLDENFVADGEPSEIESYEDDEWIDNLPIEALEREIEIEQPLSQEELELFAEYEEMFENLDIEYIDEVFEYVEENVNEADFDVADYLIVDLGYTELGAELETYFEDELGYDLNEYEGYEESGDLGGEGNSSENTGEVPIDSTGGEEPVGETGTGKIFGEEPPPDTGGDIGGEEPPPDTGDGEEPPPDDDGGGEEPPPDGGE